MLTTLQEKILQRLIDNLPKSSTESISLSNLDDLALVISASKELDKFGYIIDCSSFGDAAAILKDRGRDYFNQKNKELYGEAFAEKIKVIEDFISKAQKMLMQTDGTGVRGFAELYIRTFSNEIKNCHAGLNYWYSGSNPEKCANWKDDLNIIISLLTNYLADIKVAAHKQKTERLKIENNNIFQPNVTANSSSEVYVEVNINQTISNIMEINDKELNNDDKIELAKMLKELEKEKGKKTLWEKAKTAAVWVLGKGVETTIATLPYILKIIK